MKPLSQEIINIIDKIRLNRRQGEYALYKPILLLMIFRRIKHKWENQFKYIEYDKKLTFLMDRYGWNTISAKKSQYPFLFLASSVMWETNISRQNLKNPDSPSKRELEGAKGKINDKIYNYCLNNPTEIDIIIDFILNRYFNKLRVDIKDFD